MTGDKRVLARLINAGAENGLEPLHDLTVSRAALVRSPQEDYLAGSAQPPPRAAPPAPALGAELGAEPRPPTAPATGRRRALPGARGRGLEGPARAPRPARRRPPRRVLPRAVRRRSRSGPPAAARAAAGGRAVAMKCNLSRATGLLLQDRLRRGVRPLLARRAARARQRRRVPRHARAAALMDSCADPDNQMINRLWPDRRPLATAARSRARAGAGRRSRTQAEAAASVRRSDQGGRMTQLWRSTRTDFADGFGRAPMPVRHALADHAAAHRRGDRRARGRAAGRSVEHNLGDVALVASADAVAARSTPRRARSPAGSRPTAAGWCSRTSSRTRRTASCSTSASTRSSRCVAGREGGDDAARGLRLPVRARTRSRPRTSTPSTTSCCRSAARRR